MTKVLAAAAIEITVDVNLTHDDTVDGAAIHQAIEDAIGHIVDEVTAVEEWGEIEA